MIPLINYLPEDKKAIYIFGILLLMFLSMIIGFMIGKMLGERKK